MFLYQCSACPFHLMNVLLINMIKKISKIPYQTQLTLPILNTKEKLILILMMNPFLHILPTAIYMKHILCKTHTQNVLCNCGFFLMAVHFEIMKVVYHFHSYKSKWCMQKQFHHDDKSSRTSLCSCIDP